MQDLVLIITFGILTGCMLGLSWFAGSDAPFVPTKNERIKKILRSAGLIKREVFWELGSGDGRVVIEAAKMGAISYGIEQSLIRVLYSRWRARKLKNTYFIHGDLFSFLQPAVIHLRGGRLVSHRQNTSEVDIRKADVVFIFLLPKGVEKLEPILKNTLKKGARAITQTFHFKNWKPYKKVLISDKTANTLLGKNKYEGDFWIYQV